MVSRALFPPKHHFLKILRHDFASISELRAFPWRQRRLLGTAAAAREVPVGGRTSKKLPKEVRKAMVAEYVSKYRAMNGGKFPSASDIKKEVGGGFYYVRAVLQELQFKLATTVDETSEVEEIVNSEVPLGATKGTTTVSSSYKISADNGTSCERESSSIMDERVIDKSSVPGGTSGQVEMRNDSGHMMVDTKTLNNYSEATAKDESSTVGQIAKSNGSSGVEKVLDSEVHVGTSSVSNDEILVDGGISSQGKVSEDSVKMMVDAPVSNNYIEVPVKHERSTVSQVAKTNGSSEAREILDKQVDTAIVSSDSGTLAADDSSSQGEGSDSSGQTLVDTSNMTNYNEVSAKNAKDETWIVGQTDEVEGISKEGSEFSAKPSKPDYYPSEVHGACRSTDLGKMDETSSQASELTRAKTSIWGNLKSFASSIIGIWRR